MVGGLSCTERPTASSDSLPLPAGRTGQSRLRGLSSHAPGVARARELLEGGDTSQKQIAESLGYTDVASFARIFRKAVGSAPGGYRKRFGRNGISPADVAAKANSRQKKHIYSMSTSRRAERGTVTRRPIFQNALLPRTLLR